MNAIAGEGRGEPLAVSHANPVEGRRGRRGGDVHTAAHCHARAKGPRDLEKFNANTASYTKNPKRYHLPPTRILSRTGKAL